MEKIKDINDLVTIELPESLGIRGLEDLLKYVGEHLPADVNYNVSYFADLRYNRGLMKKGVCARKLIRTLGTLSVTGTIRSLLRSSSMAFDSFQTQPAENEDGKVKAIRFMQVPGWEIEDYRKEVIQLWSDVRREIGLGYFLGYKGIAGEKK